MATDGEDRAAKRPKLDYTSPFVKILAGSEEQAFYVHKDLICAKSKFFAAACSSKWSTAEEKIVRLPEHYPNVVAALIHWLYFGVVDIKLSDEQMTAAGLYVESEYDPENKLPSFLHLYVLADRIDAIQLRNDLVDATLKESDEDESMPDCATLSYAFKQLPASAKLLKVYTELVADFCYDDYEEEADYPIPVLRALAKKWACYNEDFYRSIDVKHKGELTVKMTRPPRISWDDRAKYHEVDDVE